jgi:hypothetical protein
MKQLREGESQSYPFRSERMFSIGHEWFFSTREGIDQGPFSSRGQAEEALAEFIVSCLHGRPQFAVQTTA